MPAGTLLRLAAMKRPLNTPADRQEQARVCQASEFIPWLFFALLFSLLLPPSAS